jgi:hypothetical protein
MEPCVQSTSLSGPCLLCGCRAQKMHRPLFRRGSFCPRCCPVCAVKAAAAAATPPASEPPAQGATQGKEGGWGPGRDARGRCIDPWYRDERRFPPPWIPRRPHWFK